MNAKQCGHTIIYNDVVLWSKQISIYLLSRYWQSEVLEELGEGGVLCVSEHKRENCGNVRQFSCTATTTERFKRFPRRICIILWNMCKYWIFLICVCYVRAYLMRIQQLYYNCSTNAVDFSPLFPSAGNVPGTVCLKSNKCLHLFWMRPSYNRWDCPMRKSKMCIETNKYV